MFQLLIFFTSPSLINGGAGLARGSQLGASRVNIANVDSSRYVSRVLPGPRPRARPKLTRVRAPLTLPPYSSQASRRLRSARVGGAAAHRTARVCR